MVRGRGAGGWWGRRPGRARPLRKVTCS